MLHCLGLSDIMLRFDPDPSLTKCAESVKSKRLARTVIRSSPIRSQQKQRSSGKNQKETVAETRAHDVGSNARPHAMNSSHRQRTDEAWLISHFRNAGAQSPLYRAMGKLLEFGKSGLAHLSEVRHELGKPQREMEIRRVGSARAISQTNIWSYKMKESCTREAYDGIAEHSWSDETHSSSCRNTRETKVDDNGHSPCS